MNLIQQTIRSVSRAAFPFSLMRRASWIIPFPG